MSLNLNNSDESIQLEESKETNKSEEKSEQKNPKVIELQLGDVIKIKDPTNERLNDQTFIIHYIDSTVLKMTNIDSLDNIQLKISEDGTIGNGTITEIELLSRDEFKGYARQNKLVPETWINIHFGGDVPFIMTGEITNLEEDMIEITTYPERDVIYINFDYKGIPNDLPIEQIEIREKPQKPVSNIGPNEEQIEAPNEVPDEMEQNEMEQKYKEIQIEKVPIPDVRNQIRELIIKADQVQFGTEELGPIVQYRNVDQSKQRYSIEAQTSDLLDELLSTIPNQKRTNSVLNNIHTMIERFKQLRQLFSTFDEYGNVSNAFIHKSDYKPLEEYFKSFNKNLYWILPVVKNIKKIYPITTDVFANETNDTVSIDINEDISNIISILDTYRSSNTTNEDQNKYNMLYNELNPSFTPFEYINYEEQGQLLIEKSIQTNIHTIIDNLTDLYSSVFSKNEVKTKQFLIQKYNLGLNQLEFIQGTNRNQMNTVCINLTNPDTMSLKSFITLPEPIIRYSRVNLPGTSILDRSVLNTASLNYWELFKKTTNITTILVDEEIEYNEDNFANHIKQFISNNVTDENDKNDKKTELYNQFINNIIPKTKILFQLMKKYIVGKLSILEVVESLEPFLIYTDDLTYMQYLEITKFIHEKISEFNRNYLERGKDFLKLKRKKFQNGFQRDIFSLSQLLEDTSQNRYRDETMNEYNIIENKDNFINDSEILKKMLTTDSIKLFANVLTMQNIPLMFPSNLTVLLEKEQTTIDKNLDKSEDTEKCKNFVIAKLYNSENELMADNNKDTYFDKKYDETNYGMLDEYEKDIATKTPEEFIAFLTDKLKNKYRLENADAEYLADTLISGYKRVKDGQYAILHHPTTTNPSSYIYYIRKENTWVEDESAQQKYLQSVNSDDSGILCDLQKSCVQMVDKMNSDNDKCETIENNKLQLKEEVLNQIINEFDQKYELSKQDLEEKIKSDYEYYSNTMFPKLVQLEKEKMIKYNNQHYNLGLNMEDEKPIVVSPYAKIRDLILGQQDFVKKQNDIIRFVELFCRKAIENSISASGERESEHWLYCIKTNVELLPTFRYQMASAFINTPDQYVVFLEKLVAQIGARSDDGDTWTDKFTGREICKTDFSHEEGFYEGFKVSTRSILEEDASNRILTSSTKTNKYDTIEMKIISNIVNALSATMGINIENQKDFIISGVLESLKMYLEKEETYKKRIKEMANKGKELPSYEDLYNTTLLFFTLGMYLIALQTNIPSIQTRKTFPGCVRSFSGYPFEGSGDMSSLNYLSCVVYAIRKNSADPWKSIKKLKETAIAAKIKNAVDLLLQMVNVKIKIDEKTAYLLLNPNTTIPTEHNVALWKQFLPPLVSFKIKHLVNVSKEFESSLLSDLKNGISNQREKILVIQSKMIQFSLDIQEKIQNIITKKNVLLNNSNGEPYVENACCNERTGETTIGYFEKIDGTITYSNKIVKSLEDILMDIRHYTEAQILYSNKNTKNIYPPLNQQFDEKTIYLGFIHFCKFNSLLPMDDVLLPLCTDKPTYINQNETLNEMIQKLKNDGRNYTDKMFLRLLQVIAQKNIIQFHIDNTVKSSINRLTDTLEFIDAENDKIVEKSLRELITNALDTFDIATQRITEETRDLNNYLIRHIEDMKENILEFIQQNDGVSTRKEQKMVNEFISQLSEWNLEKDLRNEEKKISNDSLYTIVNFYKTFVQDLVITFPNIILNHVDYSDIKIPSYWGLSQKHASDIKKNISEFYEFLRNFYEDKSLNRLLTGIQNKSKNFVKLAKETPCFTTIQYKDRTLKPVFDERTSKYLFEYYLLSVFMNYIDLSQEEGMITRETKTEIRVEDLFTVEYLDEQERKINVDVSQYEEKDLVLLRGNIKELKQKTAKMLTAYIKIMNQYKDTIDISYQDIQDRIFKLKEREKIMITDRLEDKTDEERDADTILKINKLGVWSKGLQKGLRTYVKEDYDDEREFMETMMQYEKKVAKKISSPEDFEDFRDDYLEEIQQEEDIDKEAYDMSGMTEDYMDGNEYEGYEVDDYEDYN